ncbi:MAG: hypothetical protein MMC33_002416 [Icmadophila ericetorum]|nr:hypothetical protein [Icmadophila ericetorum]
MPPKRKVIDEPDPIPKRPRGRPRKVALGTSLPRKRSKAEVVEPTPDPSATNKTKVSKSLKANGKQPKLSNTEPILNSQAAKHTDNKPTKPASKSVTKVKPTKEPVNRATTAKPGDPKTSDKSSLSNKQEASVSKAKPTVPAKPVAKTSKPKQTGPQAS